MASSFVAAALVLGSILAHAVAVLVAGAIVAALLARALAVCGCNGKRLSITRRLDCCFVSLTSSTTLANHLVLCDLCVTSLRLASSFSYSTVDPSQWLLSPFIPISMASSECKIAQIENKFVCLTRLIAASCASLGRVLRNLSDVGPTVLFLRTQLAAHAAYTLWLYQPRCVYAA